MGTATNLAVASAAASDAAIESRVVGVKPAQLRSPDAARYCGFSPGGFSNMRSRGEGPRSYKVNPDVMQSTVYYLVEDLDEWIASRTHKRAGGAA